jgi:hypothetical protein
MLFSLLYFLVRRLLGAGGRDQVERDIELLVLRHQVKVLQRQVARDDEVPDVWFDRRPADPELQQLPADPLVPPA